MNEDGWFAIVAIVIALVGGGLIFKECTRQERADDSRFKAVGACIAAGKQPSDCRQAFEGRR